MIALRDLPFPPSDNRLHRNGKKSYIRFKSGEYLAYEHLMSVYRLANKAAIDECKQNLTSMHKLDVFLYFEPSRLFTKKGAPKRIDTCNFLKGFLDQLAKMLEIDDSEFWEVRVLKLKSSAGKSYVDCLIEPFDAAEIL